MSRFISLVASKHTKAWLGVFALVFALGYTLFFQAKDRHWAEVLEMQGSPEPAKDALTATGFVKGQNHFLGTRERGETYRWMKSVARGNWLIPRDEMSDNAPTGRPDSRSRSFGVWLQLLHRLQPESLEKEPSASGRWVAFIEPIALHLAALLGLFLFGCRVAGPFQGGMLALLGALDPLLSRQFLVGVVDPRILGLLLLTLTAALLCCAALSRILLVTHAVTGALLFSCDPTLGIFFTLISSVVLAWRGTSFAELAIWGMTGATSTFALWCWEDTSFSTHVTELRYMHPWHASLWLGIALLAGAISGRERLKRWTIPFGLFGALACTPLILALHSLGVEGWLRPAALLQRLTSLDDSHVHTGLLDFLASTSVTDAVFVLVLPLTVLTAIGLEIASSKPSGRAAWTSCLILGLLLVASLHSVRLIAATHLLAFTALAAHPPRRFASLVLVGAATVFIVIGGAWPRLAPPSLRPFWTQTSFASDDVEALLNRQLAHRLCQQTPSGSTFLAPPELSDSLWFHGNLRVLMSTAWETFPGQVAASRLLSAPEATEVEAVMQSREITHLLIPSWDRALPLLVRKAPGNSDTTFFERLDRWVLPAFLRPIPLPLPGDPHFKSLKLTLFGVCAPQDEALALTRLAEYFLEMQRPIPAGEVAGVLEKSYPDDLNGMLARASYLLATQRSENIPILLDRIASRTGNNQETAEWERRVQRAIVLAQGKRHEKARQEVESCIKSYEKELGFTLSPLQAHRLSTLCRAYGFSAQAKEILEEVAPLAAEYTHEAGRKNQSATSDRPQTIGTGQRD